MVERTRADELVAAQFANAEDDIVFVAASVGALRRRYDPTRERGAGSIADDVRLGVELEQEVSSDSGRNDILLRLLLLLDGVPFCSQYPAVGAVAVRHLTQPQFLDPGRVECGEGRRGDGLRHEVYCLVSVSRARIAMSSERRRDGWGTKPRDQMKPLVYGLLGRLWLAN
jgi:hypothetical protein